jgi:hypothetical protein
VLGGQRYKFVTAGAGVALFLILFAVPLRAAEPSTATSAPAAKGRDHDVAIMLSLFHLAFPMLELTTEFRIAPWLGAGPLVGAGHYRGSTLLDLGGEARVYPAGSFDGGFYVGAVYQHLKFWHRRTEVEPHPCEADAGWECMRGAAVASPFVGHIERARFHGRQAWLGAMLLGFKHTVRAPRRPDGLTVDGGLELGVLEFYGDASVDPVSKARRYRQFAPLFYVRAGWAF